MTKTFSASTTTYWLIPKQLIEPSHLYPPFVIHQLTEFCGNHKETV